MNGSLWRGILMRFLLIAVLAGVGAGGFFIWQEQLRARRIAAEIETLRREAEAIERDNQSLTEKIAYFQSPDFEEREAKEKLGLRRLDESVVSLQGVPAREDQTPAVDAPAASSPTALSVAVPNYQKWWQRFRRTVPPTSYEEL